MVSTIKGLESNINFTSDIDTAYMGLSLGKVTIQNFQNMIDILPSSNWNTILYWYAVVDKYNIENQTTIERALDSSAMMANGLPAETTDSNGKPCFLIYDRYLMYGYFWANKYGYDQNKWNLTAAYANYDTAINYSQTNSGVPPLWIYGDNSAKSYSGRYYDETAQSLDGYLEFYKFGITQALGRAEDLWNFANSHYWNGLYYGYTGVNGLYECESGGFDQIIWKLQYYDPAISNTQNLLTDINTRYLNSLWNSPQWLDYVVQHANSNPQRRLENTQIDWQSIIAAYPLLSSSSQTNIQELLEGTAYGITNNNNINMPAWSLLSNSAAGLYDSTTGLYRIHSDALPNDSATILAANLLMEMGIIQTTASLATPLEELHYEYNYNLIDKDLYAMDLGTNSIKISIMAPGNLTFIYGSTPLNCNFPMKGVWNITFSSDWNSITNVNFIGQLPVNRIYLAANNGKDNIQPNYIFTEAGFQLPVTVPVGNGVNIIQIYADSTLVFNSSITVNHNSDSIICPIQTNNMSIGNHTLTLNVNNTVTTEIAGITYVGDLNGDFKVDSNDFMLFLNAYINYNSVNGNQYDSLADINHEGKINADNFFAFLNAYITYNEIQH